jgi:nitrate reductase gamma subunit
VSVAGVSRLDVIVYAIVPYIAIAIFVAGHWWRYRHDRYGWGARSTQLLESRTLRYASNIFHLGVLAAIGGHVLGILIPISWTRAVGVPDESYHVLSAVGGITAGTAVIVGLLLLIYRRARFARVRVTTTRMDLLVFALLAIGIATGMWATLDSNLGHEVHYRETVAPYFRSLFAGDPQPDLMVGGGVPFIFQFHVVFVWLLYAAWPFSRLVHAWSIPVDFFRRSPIPYRGRGPRARPAARGMPAGVTQAGGGRVSGRTEEW